VHRERLWRDTRTTALYALQMELYENITCMPRLAYQVKEHPPEDKGMVICTLYRNPSLLTRSNELSLPWSIMWPSSGQRRSPILCGVLLHACFKLGSEVSNKPLNGPRESFTQGYKQSVASYHRVSDIPQIVWPSTCFVSSCNISISRSLAWPFSNRFIICSVHLLPSRHGVHWPHDSCL
jgi:hypothetical protein